MQKKGIRDFVSSDLYMGLHVYVTEIKEKQIFERIKVATPHF